MGKPYERSVTESIGDKVKGSNLHLGLVARLVGVPSVDEELLVLDGLGARHRRGGSGLRRVPDLKMRARLRFLASSKHRNCHKVDK